MKEVTDGLKEISRLIKQNKYTHQERRRIHMLVVKTYPSAYWDFHEDCYVKPMCTFGGNRVY